MISESILFYWSKGAETRRKIIILIDKSNKGNKPCFLNILAGKLKASHVGIKKHIDLLMEEKYIKPINPKGKPIYLKLSIKGEKLIDDMNAKK